jgi:RimJ/RimL family protein N-acetyltransferase
LLLEATPTLTTARLRLVPLTVADAADLATAMSDPSIFTFIGGQPPMVDEVAARIGRYLAGPPKSGDAWHNWAIRLRDAADGAGALIGHLQATVREAGRSVEIAWLVGTPWQRRGYAVEAAAALRDWLDESGAGEVVAHIAPGNIASERVAERIGLHATDELQDGEVVWRLRRRDAATP